MADKSGLQHVPHSTDLVVSEARSGLIIRGFNDAKSLLAGKVASLDEDDAQTHLVVCSSPKASRYLMYPSALS